jgi:hypothetical protein
METVEIPIVNKDYQRSFAPDLITIMAAEPVAEKEMLSKT